MANGDPLTLKRPKKLIICCDGTWIDSNNSKLENNGSHAHPKLEVQDPSNVTRIGRALPVSDSQQRPQIVFYQAGVGTGPNLVEKLVGGGTGSGLSENVCEAYGFLANNYQPGDAVYLTGFSRGAFTARSIAALIDAVGLLTKTAMRHFFRVFEDFERAGQEGHETSITQEIRDFKIEMPSAKKPLIERRKEYLAQYLKELMRLDKTREIPIQAIGVWDTVGALGIPTIAHLQRLGLPSFLADPLMVPNPYRFTDTTIGKNVRFAFQALALDEERTSFMPTVWEQPDAADDDDNNNNNNNSNSTTVLKQVWFPGTHANVGGSESDSGLADVSLAWMMSELEKAGLEFDESYLADQWRQNRFEYAEREADRKLISHASSFFHHPVSTLASATSTTLLRLLRSPLSFLPATVGSHHDEKDDEQVDSEEARALRAAARDESEPHWALTRLDDSAANVTALGGLAPRTPRAHRRVDYATGKQTSEILQGTRERVHASVRVRVQARGRGYDGHGVYRAEALRRNGWVLERGEGDQGGQQGRWRWVNKDGGKEVRGKVLEEDELGRFEVMLLREDADVAAWVLGKGEGRARVGSFSSSSSASGSL
ncbi:Uncharacterized protein DBV05_g3680 [Lasiodiplodia theobromae]|uniref:T6SS Phospholipase effector Tle1-like catalytic domain-containing protein n=1 Tax=Lasiodiplodia theobromae TaxID=45133 RepID=A0A5N5DJZ9_9PEZI|nr:Uncharacterized protein DBV05_g3680 [Lasiodiplodia theobromae]